MDVLYFGRKAKEVPNTCSCGISERPGEEANEFEYFKELEDFLMGTDVKDKINLQFINIDVEDMKKYPEIVELAEKHPSPYISVNNREFLVGKSHNVNVYMKIKSQL